ncbi:Ger(x)C family spore germination protein [Pontibacillus sp. HMF3514]|uniref:Ger(x)C family spore germination protein n=1 Tax=Pontibacillus sp. HMF3514 TaxID=2692425 RepID=UPI00131F6D6B|nr:Ger(x)C family spore germination protein [Pontibacillus sp. HMF3514]QHE51204.1 Ger(x)C family spore germination protein [Pontibacillus sp. HMF3514]
MKKLISLLVVCLLLTGCVEKKYIEKLGVITVIGYDVLEEGLVQGTMVFFQFDPSAQNVSQIITSIAKTSKGIRQDGNLKSSKELVSGQLRLVVFGKKAAESGTARLLDTLNRDASISDLLYLTVAEENAKDILQSNKMEDAADIGNYLKSLIEKNIRKEVLPSSTLHRFMHDYHDVGLDPILPMVGLADGKPVIYHLALFQGDRFVKKVPVKQGFYLKLLESRFRAGHLETTLPEEPFKPYLQSDRNHKNVEGIQIAMDEISSKTKIKLVDPKALKFKVDVNIKTRILEISEDIQIQNPKVLKLMEEELSKNIENKMEELVEVIKEAQVDPVGFGKKYNGASRKKKLTKEEWREKIKDIEVEFNVNAKILRHGIIQ